ncbi:hypothetical protein [Streptacidiphilus jiangxiensis]|uniref:Uncharacterized protein n=1 Tax=Streptacidiphilus jiangxiensis TaxID=235985 RepID=A0A1H7Q219_STRJI|nr:hypothetical protein [Streptacidiphilus jiangxiensis]SEL41758.1 hypothetical protein SAMN05414137_108234 [Streptacidiphilus jiangxiensis]
MSARRKVLAGAVAVAAAGAAVVLPGVAQAATAKPVAGKSPLVMTLGRVQSGPLMPGGRAKVFDLSIANPTGKAVSFGVEVGGSAHGALSLDGTDVKLNVTPVHAPATTVEFGGQDGGMLGFLYPKHGQVNGTFVLPAHSTYTWKVSLAATKAWPLNDDRFYFGFNADTRDGREVSRSLDLKVGTARTGGPIVQSLTGGNVLAPGKPLVLRYTLTNRTGAAVTQKLEPWIVEQLPGGGASAATIAYDLWENGRWVQLDTDGAGLPKLPAHWANGQSVSYTFRMRLVRWNAGAPTSQKVLIQAAYDPFLASADRLVTVTH